MTQRPSDGGLQEIRSLPHGPENTAGNLEMLSSLAVRIDQRADEQNHQQGLNGYQHQREDDEMNMGVLPMDDFEAELTAFLQGEVHLGILND